MTWLEVILHQHRIVALCYFLLLINHVFSRSSPFDLQHLPRFLHTSNNFTFKSGHDAKLECAITNLGDKEVIWRRASDATPLTIGSMAFSEDPRISLEHEEGSNRWNLIIKQVTKADAGVYECQVSSRMRHLRHHVTLMVIDADPPSVRPKIQISGSNYVDEGDRIHLVCNATSNEYSPEDIDWFRNGDALSSRPSVGMFITKKVFLSTGTIHSTLEIKSANLSDQGYYVCRISNRDVNSIYVNVLNGPTKNVKRGTEKKNDVEAAYESSSENSAPGSYLNSPLFLISLLATTIITSTRTVDLEVT